MVREAMRHKECDELVHVCAARCSLLRWVVTSRRHHVTWLDQRDQIFPRSEAAPPLQLLVNRHTSTQRTGGLLLFCSA